MLFLVVLLGVATVVLAAVLARTSSRRTALEAALAERETALTQARAEASAADERTDRAAQERDDALERVNRARRDAAEVANRLRDETSAREAAEQSQRDLAAELDAARVELDAARAELGSIRAELEAHECPAPAIGDLTAPDREPSATRDPVEALDADVLWALALAQVEQTWRVSLAVGPAEDSPLRSGEDLFRRAIEIEVEAAREEAGADVELRWEGAGAEVPSRQAVLAWALVRDVITRYATVAAHTELTLRVDEDAVELRVEATDDDGRPTPVRLPAPLEVGPGVVRVA